MIENNQDLALAIPDATISDMLRNIEDNFQDALDRSSAQGVFNYGRSLIAGSRLQALGLARYLVLLDDQWPTIAAAGQIEEPFEEVAVAELGLSSQTIRKYTSLWRRVYDNKLIADEVKFALAGMPITMQLKISKLAEEGEATEEQWAMIAHANSAADISEIVRSVRGEQTSSNTRILIAWDMEGSLKARRGDGPWIMIGYLNKGMNNEVAVAALARILTNAGIMEM